MKIKWRKIIKETYEIINEISRKVENDGDQK
jgi:hypothetical protein